MIKFNRHNVVDTATGIKCRVSYNLHISNDGAKYVIVKTKDYNRPFQKIFPNDYINNGDMREDYHEYSRIKIFETDARYKIILPHAQADAKRWEDLRIRNEEKFKNAAENYYKK
jgi:hypothetical protein